MKTLREKITFFLSACVYLVFHLRIGSSAGMTLAGTTEQLLTTAPYCIGFTWILVIIIRYLHHGKRPAWDRIARIYFTIGICFGFYFGLYDYSDRAYQQSRSVRSVQENGQETQITQTEGAVSSEH